MAKSDDEVVFGCGCVIVLAVCALAIGIPVVIFLWRVALGW